MTTQQEDPIPKTVIEWNSYLKSTGSKAPAGKWHKNWGRENYSPRVKEANILPRSPLLSSHTKWWVGRSFAICSPHGSPSSCHEWISTRCWTPGTATDTVLATSPILVARHGCQDAEADQLMWAMHPTLRQSYQSPKCDWSLLPHLWSCYMFTLPPLRLWWSWINPQTWLSFWSFVTILWNTSCHMWLLITLQTLLLCFCGKDTSQSLEHQPSSWATDRANFESSIIRELCKLMGIQKVRTSPYHAQTNGQKEQAHQMLICMIGK